MTEPSFSAYGLNVNATFPLPVESRRSVGQPDVVLHLASDDELRARWHRSTHGPVWQTVFPNGSHVRCERGTSGDHLILFGPHASFYLCPDSKTLLCAPERFGARDWQRFLLDTVLHCVSIFRGFEALHASAVTSSQGPIAFVSVTGGGKSLLAAEMMHRGHRLFCDDVLVLSRVGNSPVLAHPGPPLMNAPIDASPSLESLGEVIEPFPDEGVAWMQVPEAAREPAAPAAVFLLERRDGASPQIVRKGVGPVRLVTHALALGVDPARALARFGLLRDLASHVPLYRLQADVAADADEVADLVTTTLSERVLLTTQDVA